MFIAFPSLNSCLIFGVHYTPATPHVIAPLHLAGLRGRNLALIQPRLLRPLARLQIEVSSLLRKVEQTFPLPEEWALRLALLFRALAPMRNRDNIGLCAEAILETVKKLTY